MGDREKTQGLSSSPQRQPFMCGISPSLIIHTVLSSSVQLAAGGQSLGFRVTVALIITEKSLTFSLPLTEVDRGFVLMRNAVG